MIAIGSERLLWLLVVAALTGCGIQETRVGAAMGHQGCNESAGYVWSALLHDCVRPFELPIQMTDLYTSTTTTTFGAYAHISEDTEKAEVFHLALKGGSLILYKAPAGTYKSKAGDYVFQQDTIHGWQLKKVGRQANTVLASQE